MNTTVKLFVNPTVKVRVSNIKVDVKNYKFELLLETKTNRQKIWRQENISGSISKALRDWLLIATDEKIKVVADNERGYDFVPSGRKLTGFQKFLTKKGIEFTPGILSTLTFESDNNSDNYFDNPFKIMTFLDQEPKLTLVNVAPKKVIVESDPQTGKSSYYSKEQFIKMNDGSIKKAFFSNKYFIRLKTEIEQVVQNFKEHDVNMAEV